MRKEPLPWLVIEISHDPARPNNAEHAFRTEAFGPERQPEILRPYKYRGAYRISRRGINIAVRKNTMVHINAVRV